MTKLNRQRERRVARSRSKIRGGARVPRLAVFRSNKHIYAQLINDDKHETIVSVSDKEVKTKDIGNRDLSFEVGRLIASKAKQKKITSVVFDKRWYKYHGRVASLAQGAREGGLKL